MIFIFTFTDADNCMIVETFEYSLYYYSAFKYWDVISSRANDFPFHQKAGNESGIWD